MIIATEPDFWRAHSKHPLLDRIGTAPKELLHYVTAVNAAAYPEAVSQPVLPYQIPSDFLDDIRGAIAQLPEIVQTKLESCLLGVFLASGVGSSAITDVVVQQDGRLLGSVVLLDAEVFLTRSANVWMTWKESTPFAAHSDVQLNAQIAYPEDDHRQQALQYLLLHEFGHVLSVDTEFLPNWWLGSQKFKDTEEYSFLSICWQIAMNGDIIPLIRHNFEQRSKITYYTKPQLDAECMSAVYQSLSHTSFPTLYASTTVYEDFADSFASFVHVVLMKKPWQIQIFQANQPVLRFFDFWSSSRAQRKAQIFAKFLQASP
ncbi:hypothetical protein H8K52_16470 [Undibacterium seohonense]|uniref:Uncharacterized protein n=1 Tax=Undibacterium seohonense TaxID=1344950 RepID=A0ABR6X989_9BURK|nr:hypothetical protein [Undibacterium seohonense]MBC3808936.1 hypothetical protein [Undibacterium seohonense]